MVNFDKILKEKRGYISKLPDNKKAVMIMSGGLDSSITCARLLKENGLEIFPLHINRGQTNWMAEGRAAAKFVNFLRKKFKGKIHRLETISLDIPPKKLKPRLLNYMKKCGHPLRDTMMQLVAVQYAISLSQRFNDKIGTIFSATGPEDPFPHCTLKSMRANNMSICENLADWDLVVTSPNIDNNIFKESFGKIEEIIWAKRNKLPIEDTISCYQPTFKKGKYWHCGECLACLRRKKAFFDARAKDQTLYLTEL